mgnify:CR=1 FL=1
MKSVCFQALSKWNGVIAESNLENQVTLYNKGVETVLEEIDELRIKRNRWIRIDEFLEYQTVIRQSGL